MLDFIKAAKKDPTWENIDKIPESTLKEIELKIKFLKDSLKETEMGCDGWHFEVKEYWVVQGESRERLQKMLEVLKEKEKSII